MLILEYYAHIFFLQKVELRKWNTYVLFEYHHINVQAFEA